MNFPRQQPSDRRAPAAGFAPGLYDMREGLTPRRLTIAMWDTAYLMRHAPGGAFADYDRVLEETVERGYNTVRIDPMPQCIELARPDAVLKWPDPQMPFMPWMGNRAVTCPAGRWLIEFMEKLLARPSLHYTLSGWWSISQTPDQGPPALRVPRTHAEGAEMWATMLRQWQQRFGLDRLVYVDLANEVPFFFPGFLARYKQETGTDWQTPSLTAQQIAFLAKELNEALRLLRREFPQLRFTCSIHGDLRWLDVPVEFDCLDVHFYADTDPRWLDRTRFDDFMPQFFRSNDWHAEFSDRCTKTAAAMAPMLRARQRHKLAQFAAWAEQRGMPLTTSESWASWFYIDSPQLDWGWFLDWAAWSVEDAIEYRMWGWTPHNCVAPQFANWQDAAWHQRLTEKFLRSGSLAAP